MIDMLAFHYLTNLIRAVFQDWQKADALTSAQAMALATSTSDAHVLQVSKEPTALNVSFMLCR